MAVLFQLLNAVVAQVSTLGLKLGDNAVSVALRKLPRAEETIDTLPLIAVNKAEKVEGLTPSTFDQSGGRAWLKSVYYLDVTSISAGNHDYTSTNIGTYADWREAVRDLFRPPWATPIIGVPALYDLDVQMDVFLDRRKLAEQYDYQTIRLVATCDE